MKPVIFPEVNPGVVTYPGLTEYEKSKMVGVVRGRSFSFIKKKNDAFDPEEEDEDEPEMVWAIQFHDQLNDKPRRPGPMKKESSPNRVIATVTKNTLDGLVSWLKDRYECEFFSIV